MFGQKEGRIHQKLSDVISYLETVARYLESKVCPNQPEEGNHKAYCEQLTEILREKIENLRKIQRIGHEIHNLIDKEL